MVLLFLFRKRATWQTTLSGPAKSSLAAAVCRISTSNSTNLNEEIMESHDYYHLSETNENEKSWDWESLAKESDRLLSLFGQDDDDMKEDELSRTDISEFMHVLRGWIERAPHDGLKAAAYAHELLMALEDNFDRVVYEGASDDDDVVVGRSLVPSDAMYNFVLQAHAVSGGGRQAAEQAQSLLESMMARYTGFAASSTVPPAPTTISFNIAIHAWAKSGEEDAGMRAEDIFGKLEAWQHGAAPNTRTLAAVMDAWSQTSRHPARVTAMLKVALKRWQRDGAMPPHVIWFNSAIHAWVNSGRFGAEQAEEILTMLEELQHTHEDLAPTDRTYSLVLNAWAQSEKEDGVGLARAKEILEKMIRLYQEGNERVKPNVIVFTTVITALSRSKHSLEEAEALLDRMLQLYKETGDEDMKPTAVTANAVITAWARSKRDDAPIMAEAVLRRMHEFCEPDVYSYNSVINAYANKGDMHAARRLLQDMKVEPDGVSYNTVLHAMAKSRHINSAQEAEKLLEQMEGIYERGNKKVKPTAVSYTSVITAWSRSPSAIKSSKANSLLQKMMQRYQEGDKSAKPDVVTFTALIVACATTTGNAKAKRAALKLAIQSFEQMKSSAEFDNPNHQTYTAMFRAVYKLASDRKERRRLLKGLLQRCIDDGMLNKHSLNIFLRNVPAAMARDLIPGYPESRLPPAWYAHVARRDRPQ